MFNGKFHESYSQIRHTLAAHFGACHTEFKINSKPIIGVLHTWVHLIIFKCDETGVATDMHSYI